MTQHLLFTISEVNLR